MTAPIGAWTVLSGLSEDPPNISRYSLEGEFLTSHMRAAVRLPNLLKPRATGRQSFVRFSLSRVPSESRGAYLPPVTPSVPSSRHSITASQTGSWSGIDEDVSGHEGDGAEQTSEADENVVDAPAANAKCHSSEVGCGTSRSLDILQYDFIDKTILVLPSHQKLMYICRRGGVL